MRAGGDSDPHHCRGYRKGHWLSRRGLELVRDQVLRRSGHKSASFEGLRGEPVVISGTHLAGPSSGSLCLAQAAVALGPK